MSTYKQFETSSYLSGGNAAYVEELYEAFLQDPQSVDDHWRNYFTSINEGKPHDYSHQEIREKFLALARGPKLVAGSVGSEALVQEKVDALLSAFRRFGHLNAKINPLGSDITPDRRLTLEYHGLSSQDLNEKVKTRSLLNTPVDTVAAIYSKLQRIYCSSVGVEYSLVANEEEREWLRVQVEHSSEAIRFDVSTKKRILDKLVAADGLEKFLDTKYKGQKRFSIEGCDSLIPMLDQLAIRASSEGISELVIGMAHRGRLNVLLNLLGQSPAELCQEFEGTKDYGLTSGDVKYHKGFSSDVKTPAGRIHLALAFNPSHLEFIDAVMMGSVRARQERDQQNGKIDYCVGVVIHGDASFAGQGIVMETLAMSQTRAYYIGGVIHIVANNQVGFTTSDPRDARSSHYCTDIAKMIDAPIFHVNADDPEAVVRCVSLALDYRMKFHKDIVIDLVGYRRHGHQEVDEPRATQPLMYQIIDKHLTPKQIYAEKLIQEKIVTADEVKKMSDDYRSFLDAGQGVVEVLSDGLSKARTQEWSPYINTSWQEPADTSVSKEKLMALGKKIATVPSDFVLQPNVKKILESREKMAQDALPMDWGFAENLAYATLAMEGYPVRLSGEDCRRGTFFHRHSAYFDQKTGADYSPLEFLDEHQSPVQIYDSLLSEAGPMGFEYGYSTADPKVLVLWEAQFGDFANGGQVIFDQFVSSAWQKWNRLSSLVFLLPHGCEGQGPEHSSARLERFLQLCAQDNMQVVVPTTPAQIFHVLRRQMIRPVRLPLIVMSPKSLLRHKLATSTLDELSKGEFQLIIPEIDDIDPKKVKRVVLCSGKIYYELLTQRRTMDKSDTAIIRIEQLYPFPHDRLRAELEKYAFADNFVWCQEEPQNQGAWFSTWHRLKRCLPHGKEIRYAGSAPMSSPAPGYGQLFKKLQQETLDQALL